MSIDGSELKEGDALIFDNTEWIISQIKTSIDGMWLKRHDNSANSQVLRWMNSLELLDLCLTGRVVFTGDPKPSAGCEHQIVTYTGFTDIFDYCNKCGEKKR